MTELQQSERGTRRDRFLMIFALGLGTGCSPYAPGTVGSTLGPVLFWLLNSDSVHPLGTALAGLLLFAIGIPICNAGIRQLNTKDPGAVVFDEIAAFAWVFLFVPVNIVTGITGFVLFRIFDIAKPWPIKRFERLPGGLGVMADDAIAGLFAGIILTALWYAFA